MSLKADDHKMCGRSPPNDTDRMVLGVGYNGSKDGNAASTLPFLVSPLITSFIFPPLSSAPEDNQRRIQTINAEY